MNEISAELLAKLIAWKRAGRRDLRLTSSHFYSQWEIWIYDYDLMAGVQLNESTAGADWDKLLIAERRKYLQAAIEKLEQYGGIAG